MKYRPCTLAHHGGRPPWPAEGAPRPINVAPVVLLRVSAVQSPNFNLREGYRSGRLTGLKAQAQQFHVGKVAWHVTACANCSFVEKVGGHRACGS